MGQGESYDLVVQTLVIITKGIEILRNCQRQKPETPKTKRTSETVYLVPEEYFSEGVFPHQMFTEDVYTVIIIRIKILIKMYILVSL